MIMKINHFLYFDTSSSLTSVIIVRRKKNPPILLYHLTGLVLDPVGHRSKGVLLKNMISPPNIDSGSQILAHF